MRCTWQSDGRKNKCAHTVAMEGLLISILEKYRVRCSQVKLFIAQKCRGFCATSATRRPCAHLFSHAVNTSARKICRNLCSICLISYSSEWRRSKIITCIPPSRTLRQALDASLSAHSSCCSCEHDISLFPCLDLSNQAKRLANPLSNWGKLRETKQNTDPKNAVVKHNQRRLAG